MPIEMKLYGGVLINNDTGTITGRTLPHEENIFENTVTDSMTKTFRAASKAYGTMTVNASAAEKLFRQMFVAVNQYQKANPKRIIHLSKYGKSKRIRIKNIKRLNCLL